MSIKVQNTGASPVSVALGSGAATVTVQLRSGDFAFAQDPRLTNSLLIFQRKGLISIKTETKPSHLMFNTPYSAASLKPAPPKEEKKEEPIELNVQNVRGNIVETKEGLKDAMKPHDQRGHKGELPEELFDQVEKEQSSILDEAKDMVSDYKNEDKEEVALKTGRWEEGEVRLLRRNYPINGLKDSAEKLNRSEKSVQKKIESLKLRKKKK